MGLSTVQTPLYYDYEFEIRVLDKKSENGLLLRRTFENGPGRTGW